MNSRAEGKRGVEHTASGSRTAAAWRGWKRFWRRIETADAVWRAKRLVRQLLGTELRYFPQLKLPKEAAGDWWYAPRLLTRDAVVYSLGVGEDIELDLALIRDFGVEVHAFDPTPGAIEFVKARQPPEGFVLHQLGIADFDGEAEFSGPVSEGNVCFTLLKRSGARTDSIRAEVRRLGTVAEQLGHDRIDLLKMDIEGAEYMVIPDFLESGLPVTQLLVEFHHRFTGVGNEKTREAIELLLGKGFRILHISPSGREYSFVNLAAVPPAAR